MTQTETSYQTARAEYLTARYAFDASDTSSSYNRFLAAERALWRAGDTEPLHATLAPAR